MAIPVSDLHWGMGQGYNLKNNFGARLKPAGTKR